VKKVYIMHPLAGDGSPEWGDWKRNLERYLAFVAWASLEGYAVVSWIHHCLLYQAGATADDPDFYLDRDCRLIDGCDEAWAAGPIKVSSGMGVESRYAERVGVPVIHKREWLDPNYAPPAPGGFLWPWRLNDILERCHEGSKAKGWWDDETDAQGVLIRDRVEALIMTKLMLCVTELAEAAEDYRRGGDMTTALVGPKAKPCGFPTELADTVIRIFDLAGALGIDLEAEIMQKLDYNEGREHRHGGKKC